MILPKYYKDQYTLKDLHSYKDVPGWMNDAESIYPKMIEIAEDGDVVVEIGTLLGQSASLMSSLIKDSGKDIKFDSIDLFWMVEQTFSNIEHSKQPLSFLKYIQDLRSNYPISIIDIVKLPLMHLDLIDYVNFITCDEKYAYRLYDDSTVKFLWIDGDHTGLAVYNDLVNFWPKIKKGGYIGGDDIVYPDVRDCVERFIKEYNINPDCIQYSVPGTEIGNSFLIKKV